MKELLEINLRGKFRWSQYSKPGNHDRKFGPTKSEYICQIPVVGLIPTVLIYGGIYAAIGTTRLFKGENNERKKKSSS